MVTYKVSAFHTFNDFLHTGQNIYNSQPYEICDYTNKLFVITLITYIQTKFNKLATTTRFRLV